MNIRLKSFFSFLVILIAAISCSTPEELKVFHEKTGQIKTNCYLMYDANSKEAAIVDAAGPIDSLEKIIIDNDLNLKYIFITHTHPDHVEGLPLLLNKYPNAKLCLSQEEYDDMSLYANWASVLPPQDVSEIKKDSVILKLFNFDYRLIGKPDIIIEDDKIYKLGNLNIRTFISPGHSRGSVCYNIENVLFSGDVLFYRRVGRTDMPQSGSQKELIKSVRRLYTLLPDETKVYPGHGQFTDIGSEKKENSKITIDKLFF